MSCTYRLEKAIQRLDGVEKVKVQVQPPRAEVTPKAGAWVEVGGLRKAVKNSGFKAGDLRYVLSGTLTEWQGKPALRLPDGDRLFLLQSAPNAPDALERARQLLAESGGRRVDVEGDVLDSGAKLEKPVVAVLRLHSVALHLE